MAQPRAPRLPDATLKLPAQAATRNKKHLKQKRTMQRQQQGERRQEEAGATEAIAATATTGGRNCCNGGRDYCPAGIDPARGGSEMMMLMYCNGLIEVESGRDETSVLQRAENLRTQA